MYRFYGSQNTTVGVDYQALLGNANFFGEAARSANTAQSLDVTVPFTSPREWNAIRSRILSTPNVRGVDLSSLGADGAVIRIEFTNTVEELQVNMQAAGLNLAASGSVWIIQLM